jgi:hypothetical protein
MSELKLRRVIEHNQRLREDLARPRCVSTNRVYYPTYIDLRSFCPVFELARPARGLFRLFI